MAWDAEFTQEFGEWWDSLTEEEQDDVAAAVGRLTEIGPTLGRPHVDHIKSSVHANMKELRVPHSKTFFRVLFAFDPRRTALLLVGGDKTGRPEWYAEFVPVADRLFSEHLATLGRKKK